MKRQKYEFDTRCKKCNSFVKSTPFHSGYCQSFSYKDGKYIGSVMTRACQEQCPYDKVV